jgi:hypothetical protein
LLESTSLTRSPLFATAVASESLDRYSFARFTHSIAQIQCYFFFISNITPAIARIIFIC